MKKLTALLLTFLFALSACTAALAWSCPSCGTEGNGNFCAECGTKRPEENICPNCGTNYGSEKPNFCMECGTRLTAAAPTEAPAAAPTAAPAPEKKYLATSDSGVNIVSVETQENGFVTITWDDLKDNGPYMARFVSVTTGNFNTDWDNNVVRNEASDISALSYTYQYLVPGESYWLVITNADRDGVYIRYDSPAVEAFADFATTVSVKPLMSLTLGDVSSPMEVSSFSAAEIALQTSEHGLYVRLDYPALDSDKEYAAQEVFTDPNGFALVDGSHTLPFIAYEEGGYRYWDFYDLAWYFDVLSYQYETLPTGTYTMSFYLDGELAAETSFIITD